VADWARDPLTRLTGGEPNSLVEPRNNKNGLFPLEQAASAHNRPGSFISHTDSPTSDPSLPGQCGVSVSREVRAVSVLSVPLSATSGLTSQSRLYFDRSAVVAFAALDYVVVVPAGVLVVLASSSQQAALEDQTPEDPL
jgi:hypothetical protein